MKSKRSKATDISQKTKHIVWERDGHRCIFCGNSSAMPNAHYISRAYGGLGIPENVVTACIDCHNKMDKTSMRYRYTQMAKEYLDRHYPDFPDENRYYKPFEQMRYKRADK